MVNELDEPVFPEYAPTLGNLVCDAAARYGDRPYLVETGRVLSFADVNEQSLVIARGLLASGVGKGTRVAILMGNSPDWVLTWLAAGRIGAVTVPMSTMYQPRELEWLLRFADIDTVLANASYAGHDYLDRLERAVPGLRESTSPELLLASHPFLRRVFVWGAAPQQDRAWFRIGPDELVAVAQSKPAIDAEFALRAQDNVAPADWLIGICTSGTTADPKVVIHTHQSVIRTTHALRAYRSVRADTGDLSALPFFWVGGINGHVLPCLYEGARLVFSPSSSAEDIVDTIHRHQVTRVHLLGVRKDALVDAAQARGIDVSGIEGIAEPVDADGNVVPPSRRGGSMLGMTETFGPHGVQEAGSILPPDKANSVGRNIAGIERRIVDRTSGEPINRGEVGELEIRGYSLMQSHYKRDRSELLSADGWLRTGDLCRMDADGYLFFENRLSDMIKTMGANVAPREVEAVLEAYPEVAEAIVFGMPDEIRGEAVVAVVVPATSTPLEVDSIRHRLKSELSSYKVPITIMQLGRDEVPRTGVGKVRKADLRDLVAASARRGNPVDDTEGTSR